MKTITVNTKIREIVDDPLFKGYIHMLDYRRGNRDESVYDMTLLEFQNNIIGWSAAKMADGRMYRYCIL